MAVSGSIYPFEQGLGCDGATQGAEIAAHALSATPASPAGNQRSRH